LLWINSHIATKLIGGTLLVIAVVFVVANYQAIRKEQTVLLDQMDTQGSLLAKVVSNSCTEPLLIKDYPVLETIAELMIKSEADLSYVCIERQDGKIVAEVPAGASQDPAVLASSRTYASPIKVSPNDISSIGRFSFGISTRRADDFIAERIRSLVTNTVISFVTITIFLFIFLRLLVSEPLRKLDIQASALGKGDWDSPITLSSRDEIGRLAATLDTMRQELDKSSKLIIEQNKELYKHTEKLEELVKERTDELLSTNKELKQEIIERTKAEVEREKVINKLQLALAEIKTLQGIVPICSFCKKIRDDKGFWNQVESYVAEHTDARFSHTCCIDCAKKHYPEVFADDQK